MATCAAKPSAVHGPTPNTRTRLYQSSNIITMAPYRLMMRVCWVAAQKRSTGPDPTESAHDDRYILHYLALTRTKPSRREFACGRSDEVVRVLS
jgi:hypothetical protein